MTVLQHPAFTSMPKTSDLASAPVPTPHLQHGVPNGFLHESAPGFQALGHAITLSEACRKFRCGCFVYSTAENLAQARVIAKAATLERLSLLRNPQAKLLLLFICLGSCKTVFAASCTTGCGCARVCPLIVLQNGSLSSSSPPVKLNLALCDSLQLLPYPLPRVAGGFAVIHRSFPMPTRFRDTYIGLASLLLRASLGTLPCCAASTQFGDTVRNAVPIGLDTRDNTASGLRTRGRCLGKTAPYHTMRRS
jgi:hypothetical protein